MRSDVEVRERALEDEIYLLKRDVQQAVDGYKQLQQMLSMLARGVGGGAGAGVTTALAQTGGSGIPAVVGTTLGNATVTLYDPTAFPSLTLTSNTATAYNSTAAAVGASKVVQLKQVGGKWFVDVESC